MNTVFEDLALNKGAVSNAILHKAGPRLQELINAEKTRGTFGEVIVTEGLQLKSFFVYHVVTPNWDKGQGTAQKVLLNNLWRVLNTISDLSWLFFNTTHFVFSCLLHVRSYL